MLSVSSIAAFLENFAPNRLAAEWDNVGLLVGDGQQDVERVITCLTVTPASVAEAVAEKADLIVTHHPLPFRPVRRLTADTPEGRMLLDLIAAALREDPHLAKFSGRVSDSGEGRWTVHAAIDEGVPAPVISAALYARFSSRGENAFADKLLSAMRYEFGGHVEKNIEGQ